MTRQRTDPYAERRGRAGLFTWILRLFFLLLGLTACLTALLVIYTRWQDARFAGSITIEGGDPDLSTTERLYLQTYLSARIEDLEQPAGSNPTPVDFQIAPGQRADQIAANLEAAGLVDDPVLLVNYLRFYGLDAELEAGNYTLSPGLTVPELATRLTSAVADEITVRFLEGWRLEEMANYLRVTTPARVNADDFLAIARRETPFDLSSYNYLGSLPPEATLEGFLFPDTYRLPTDADAAYLVDLMLTTFGQRVTPAMRQNFGARGLTVFQAVTLASIVEREAPLAEERPVVAGVFLNRLGQEMRLEADPTVQYAVGYQAATDNWWKSPLFQTDLELDSPYNTYLYPGLPPGPIANPSLSAMQAVAQPLPSDFFFFVADCTTEENGDHRFSVTYEEHLANVQECR